MKFRIRLAMTLGILFMVMLCLPASAIQITRTAGGAWSVAVDETDLVGGGAGGNSLQDAYESAADEVVLAVSDTTPGVGWDVDVRRDNTNWDSDFTFSVLRTSANAGVSGGETYVEVTPTGNTFFSCVAGGDVSGIEIQEKISGIATQPLYAGTYSITITYTVQEAP